MLRWDLRGTVFMSIHTDDMDIIAQYAADVNDILQAFDKRFGITVSSPDYMLGVLRTESINGNRRSITMSQEAYIEGMYEKFKEHCDGKTVTEPFPAKTFLMPLDNCGKPIDVPDDEVKRVHKKGYMNLVGGLLWAQRNTCPGLSFAMSQICRCMQRPSEKALACGVHSLKYLLAHKQDGISFHSDGNWEPRIYYDSGHKQPTGDGRSFCFFVIMHFGGPIYWETTKHDIPAFGAGEDEYMTQSIACKQGRGYQNLLNELGLGDMVKKPMSVIGDNSQAELWGSEWAKMNTKTRHIEQKYHIVKTMVKKGWFQPLWMMGKENPADLGTKPVDGVTSNRLMPMLCGQAPLPPLPEPRGKMKKRVHFRRRRPRVPPVRPPPPAAAATPAHRPHPSMPTNCKNPELQGLAPPASPSAGTLPHQHHAQPRVVARFLQNARAVICMVATACMGVLA